MQAGDNWKCPYCGHAQVLDEKRLRQGLQPQYVTGWKHGKPALYCLFIVCANNGCRELVVRAALVPWEYGGARGDEIVYGDETVAEWKLLPPSSAKPQPDYIPKPIRDDYYEACAIRDLSAKASATVIRRCLQGMIRDFCGISKGTLNAEIKELRTRVESGKAPPGVLPDALEAIDQVRRIGNIGAHMEADINVIIDVDADEAQILIELVELLFEEWYVARELRTNRLANITAIGEEKAKQKKAKPAAEEP